MVEDLSPAGINRATTVAANKWRIQFVSKYTRAYEAAYDTFKGKLTEQQRKDAERREFLITMGFLALSLVGGSIMTAAFGFNSLKKGLSQAALRGLNGPVLDQIAKRNMEKAFRAAHFTADNATFHFVLGTAYDSLEKHATDKIKEALKGGAAQTSLGPVRITDDDVIASQLFDKPLTFMTHLDDYVNKLENGVLAAASQFETVGPPRDPERMLRQLLASPFFMQIPVVNEARLQDELEFMMWMNFLLGTDYWTESVVRMTGRERGQIWERVSSTKKEITLNPMDKAYPKGSMTMSGMTQTTKGVAFMRVGDVLRKRIDELHKTVMRRGSFFDPGGERMARTVLIRAWKRLEELGTRQEAAVRAPASALPAFAN